MAMMRAVGMDNYGGADVLHYQEMPRPEVGPGELLIRVRATTVNPFDTVMRAGYVAGWYQYTFPLVPGLDVAGVVEEVGAEVEGFAPGDEIFARLDPARNGANAEYAIAAATDAAPKPPSLSFAEAAALAHAGLSTWRSLMDDDLLVPGQTALIHGGAGGVGTIAIQLAKSRGVHVIATSSARNLDLLRELGADEVIDYTATPFEQVAHNVDVVLDTVGGDTLERSWGVLKPGGILVSLVQPPGEEAAATHGVRQKFAMGLGPASAVLKELSALVAEGKLRPIVDSVLPLSEASRAHTLVEGRHTRGRVVLVVE